MIIKADLPEANFTYQSKYIHLYELPQDSGKILVLQLGLLLTRVHKTRYTGKGYVCILV